MRDNGDSYGKFLQLLKSSREGLPHPRRTVKAMWQRLRAAYKGAPIGAAFVEQMASGPPVPILYPDEELMASGEVFGYHNGGRVYVPANAAPDTLLHELRHVNQRRRLDPFIYDSHLGIKCPRRWFLAATLVEAEAYTFERAAAGGKSLIPPAHFRILTPWCSRIQEKRLTEIFKMSATDLRHVRSSHPQDEQESTFKILEKICVLPNGENYMFRGRDLTEQWQLAGKITEMILPPPAPPSFWERTKGTLRSVLRAQTPDQIGVGSQASHGPEGR